MSSSSNSRAAQTLPRETRDAIKAVFDALSEWRDEVNTSTEKYSEAVLDKMAVAARALGWPKAVVDASHKHLMQASKAQMQMFDHLMDAWEKQKSAPAADQFLTQLRTLPTGVPDVMSNPLAFWMQAAETWQRNWASALSMWTSGSSKFH
jgi:hypothetical protein